jgi:hypothetical protein
MSNQRSFKIESFPFAAFVPKKIEYIRFETKFWIETKRFLSVLEKFGPKRFLSILEKFGPKTFVLVRFQIFFATTKSFVLSLENPGGICNVLVSF